MMHHWTKVLAVATGVLATGCATRSTTPAAGLARIDHIVVIYAENHSFDNMYGMFPGANGVANALAAQTVQRDHDGKPLERLPAVYNAGKIDPRYPAGLPNGPFRIDAPPVNARIDQVVPNPIHNYYQNMEQINGGRNDRFVALTNVGAWTMGYYDGSSQKMWQWAKNYTLADNFFMGAFGGSFLNHQWLVCACTPQFPTAPANLRAQLDGQGRLMKKPGSPASVMDGLVQLMDGPVTPDGFVSILRSHHSSRAARRRQQAAIRISPTPQNSPFRHRPHRPSATVSTTAGFHGPGMRVATIRPWPTGARRPI